MQAPLENNSQNEISVQSENNGVIIDIQSYRDSHDKRKVLTDDDYVGHSTISGSSGDELENSTDRCSKGILKSRHNRSLSMCEASADEANLSSMCTNYYSDSHDFNSESECSKKTVRFNDVVSRQLFRYKSDYCLDYELI